MSEPVAYSFDLMLSSGQSLLCSPEPRLSAGEQASRAVVDAFRISDAWGLLHLATVAREDDLPAPLLWARDWGAQFLLQLCQVRDPAAIASPESGILNAALLSTPPMWGAEYVSERLLMRLWEDLRDVVSEQAAGHAGGLNGWLRESGGLWHLVGRVTFHLAENKRNEAQPFAFLATYTDQISASGRVQHIPLGRALQTYTDRKNQPALEALLQPVRAAAEQVPLVRELLETRRLFQALAWTPQDAYQFLRAIPQLEQSGLVVKVPDWWKNNRPSRPVVSVTLEAAPSGGVGLASMLAFNANVTLAGVKLTPEELSQIHASASGLVNLRGQWVEVEPEQLQRVLAHWTRVQAAHEAGRVSFHQGMRWLAGFSGVGEMRDDAPDLDSNRDWSEVVAGKDLRVLLDQFREPVNVESPPGLLATLRPYQLRGMAWLHSLSRLGLGACLADDMGLGKTVQIIALLCLRFAETGGKSIPSILVVPASLMGNWIAEFKQFAPHLKVLPVHPSTVSREIVWALNSDPASVLQSYGAVLTTYGMLQRSEALLSQDWDLAVLDEAQAIKNPATAQARTVKKLRARARLALTGTPIENRLGDLWSLFDFLNPGLLGRASEFAELSARLGTKPGGYTPLKRLISPYLLRRMKTDRRIIADLPDKVEVQARCPLTKKQALLYGKLVEQLKADLANPTLDPNQRRGLVLGT